MEGYENERDRKSKQNSKFSVMFPPPRYSHLLSANIGGGVAGGGPLGTW